MYIYICMCVCLSIKCRMPSDSGAAWRGVTLRFRIPFLRRKSAGIDGHPGVV